MLLNSHMHINGDNTTSFVTHSLFYAFFVNKFNNKKFTFTVGNFNYVFFICTDVINKSKQNFVRMTEYQDKFILVSSSDCLTYQ